VEKLFSSYLRNVRLCLKNTSSINCENWDNLKLATSLIVIFGLEEDDFFREVTILTILYLFSAAHIAFHEILYHVTCWIVFLSGAFRRWGVKVDGWYHRFAAWSTPSTSALLHTFIGKKTIVMTCNRYMECYCLIGAHNYAMKEHWILNQKVTTLDCTLFQYHVSWNSQPEICNVR
jgi:hypothetical protein